MIRKLLLPFVCALLLGGCVTGYGYSDRGGYYYGQPSVRYYGGASYGYGYPYSRYGYGYYPYGSVDYYGYGYGSPYRYGYSHRYSYPYYGYGYPRYSRGYYRGHRYDRHGRNDRSPSSGRVPDPPPASVNLPRPPSAVDRSDVRARSIRNLERRNPSRRSGGGRRLEVEP